VFGIRPGVSFDARELGLRRGPPRKSHPWLTLLAIVLWAWLLWQAAPYLMPALILLRR
jgi:hypothetical protein